MILIETRCFQETVARRPLADQRQLADAAGRACRLALPGAALQSRSHSRGVAMTAMGDATISALGVDVEHTDLRRPWREILSHAGAMRLDEALPADCCRAWTVLEAFFKAFGDHPPPGVLDDCLSAPASREPVLIGADVWRASSTPVEGFEASVVWRGPRLTPTWSA